MCSIFNACSGCLFVFWFLDLIAALMFIPNASVIMMWCSRHTLSKHQSSTYRDNCNDVCSNQKAPNGIHCNPQTLTTGQKKPIFPIHQIVKFSCHHNVTQYTRLNDWWPMKSCRKLYWDWKIGQPSRIHLDLKTIVQQKRIKTYVHYTLLSNVFVFLWRLYHHSLMLSPCSTFHSSCTMYVWHVHWVCCERERKRMYIHIHVLRRMRCAYEVQPKSLTRPHSRVSKWKDRDRKNKAPASAAAAQWETRCWTQRQNNNNASNHALSVRARFFPSPCSFFFRCVPMLLHIVCRQLNMFLWIYPVLHVVRAEQRNFVILLLLRFYLFISLLSVHCCWWILVLVCITHSIRLVVRTHHTNTVHISSPKRNQEKNASFIRK